MLWIKSWAIGFVISIVIVIAIWTHTPLGMMSNYLEVPLFPGFLMSRAFLHTNGPPLGMIWLLIASVAPVFSGSLIYGFIVYLILRLRNEFRKGNAI